VLYISIVMLNLCVHTCSQIDPIYHRNLSGHSLSENHIDWLRADSNNSAEK
jgi:hypothetical protein